MKKLLAVAVSLLSLNAVANDAFVDGDFNSANDIADHMAEMYSDLGGVLSDFVTNGEGAMEAAQLLQIISAFHPGAQAELGFDDDNQLVINTEGTDAHGTISNINDQIDTFVAAVETDLFGSDFEGNSWDIDGSADDQVSDAEGGLAADELNEINNALKDVIDAIPTDDSTDDDITAFNTALDYFQSGGGFETTAAKFNDARDGLTTLTAEIGSHTFTISNTNDSDYDVDGKKTTNADDNSAQILRDDYTDNAYYLSYLDFVIDNKSFEVDNDATSISGDFGLGDNQSVKLPVGAKSISVNDDGYLQFTLEDFSGTDDLVVEILWSDDDSQYNGQYTLGDGTAVSLTISADESDAFNDVVIEAMLEAAEEIADGD